ncbi:uncharacterized protein LOC114359394 [Ostrinia furnacalis]|uniref:uncharacterized protein LOC114359394 n=1 Tax=Ostrinia furnacalis TaxID=93504 RepID=UPI00104071E9|nr:uncharacterized protein LOC114359394 [Ostrinia furnacalis]
MTSFGILNTLLFFIIFHRNYLILFRYPRRIASTVPSALAPRSSSVNNRFTSIYLDGVQTVFLPSYILNDSILWSNGEGRGDNGDDKQEASQAEEPKEPESKEAPESKDAAVQTDTEVTERSAEERRSTPGYPDPPHTTSRIPTYDEYARYRDPIRPPDSHYPPGPGPFYRRRSAGDTVKVNFKVAILGLGVYSLL